MNFLHLGWGTSNHPRQNAVGTWSPIKWVLVATELEHVSFQPSAPVNHSTSDAAMHVHRIRDRRLGGNMKSAIHLELFAEIQALEERWEKLDSSAARNKGIRDKT